ncbi:MAG TPA: tetratricopeptide repeat protein [Thermoanaerobaculia bacterium]|nr:tetratricopeptide repeat protein [Thermoanaerobaculia bacterium]
MRRAFRDARFRALIRSIYAERERAAVTVEPLLNKTPRAKWPQLAEHPDLQNSGAVQRIGQLFAEAYSRDSKYALALAQLAVAAAEAIPATAYPAVVLSQILAYAWKDLGKALRTLARYEESAKALHHAESLLVSSPDHGSLEYDIAVVRFNLAIVYQEIGRHKESMPLLTESKQVFRDYDDERLVVMVGIAEGALLQRLARYREARETYLLILASSSNLDDESLAALHHAIGLCSVELGDLQEAEANFTKGIVFFQKAGRPLDALKPDAGKGRLFVRRGEYERAITHLRTVRRRFLSYAMPEEAGISGLDIVEALLALGRHSQAETLARKIVREFTVANLNSRAITALGYLSEAITAQRASTSLVTHVREYILSLRTYPEREFSYEL